MCLTPIKFREIPENRRSTIIFLWFTRKEAETADQYIEKTVHEIGRQYKVTVATSDATEQVIVLSQGAVRMSARELAEEIRQTNQEIRTNWLERHPNSKDYLLDHIPEEMTDLFEDVRLGKKKL